MSRWLFGILSVCVVLAPLASATAESQKRPTVLELFTSQGCSSCPPADRLLGRYAKRGDIIALSFHVDYWDYIGWKDTFATGATTGRQRGYGQALSQRHLYTPEIVVEGRAHTVGSNRAEIDKLIGNVKVTDQPLVDIDLKISDSVVVASVSSKTPLAAEVWLFEIDRRHDVDIRRGENTGNVLSYHNVVRGIHRLGRWDGGRRDYSRDLTAARRDGRDGVVVIVQRPGQGPVLGAAQIWLTDEGS
jgi:hypothetical protein